MKKIAAFFFFLLLFNNCQKDFSTISDWEEQMVVYGLLDIKDSRQYLKITKAFLGDGKVLKYAANPDSNQYNFPLDVSISELDENQHVVRTILFDTIHTQSKDSGLFYSPGQILYRSRPYDFYDVVVYTEGFQHDTIFLDTIWLNPEHHYRLHVKNPKSGLEVSSETGVVNYLSFTKPKLTTNKFTISNAEDNSNTVKWSTSNTADIFQIKIYFHYDELYYGSDDTLHKRIPIVNEMLKDKFQYKLIGQMFFNTCNQAIKYKDAEQEAKVRKRMAQDMELYLIGGNETLYKYMIINEPSTGLIQDKPVYSNIDGGIGIFGSRTKVLRLIPLDDVGVSVLQEDYDLKF